MSRPLPQERLPADPERDALLARERAAREEAQAAVQARDEVLAIVSHDLRNPLQTLAMGVAALEALAGEKGAAVATRSRRAIERMELLIRDLLDVNQIASGRFKVDPVRVAVAELIEDARSAAAPLCEAKGLTLEAHAGETAHVMADRARMGQVFSNLVGNAVKFTPEGGVIRLGARRQDGDVVFDVADSGPGIAAEDLPHIFERFWQARRVRRGGGVGLGLPITHGIVHAHGGRIWASSRPGVGTTFSFSLPVAK